MSDKTAQSEAVREVDRIREIIFGTNMREYEQRFQAVQQELDRLQKAIDQLNAQLNEKMAAQDSSQSKKLQDVQAELHQADESLRNELHQAVAKLSADKTDRALLGDLLIQLAGQLKADKQ